jgi:hypothetical protein
MTVDETIRAATRELHHATETRAVPPPRFAAATPNRAPRRRLVLVGLALTASIAVIAAVALTGDNDAPSKIDTTNSSTTVSVTTTEGDEPPNLAPPPSQLPNYLGVPSDPSEILERWGASVAVELAGGVTDPTKGRVIRQQPPGGTPFTAGMTVTFTIGPRLSILEGEFEIGSGPSSTKGPWRIVVSTTVGLNEQLGGKYSIVMLSETTSGMTTGGAIDTKQHVSAGEAFAGSGLIVGQAPPNATTIQLLTFGGVVVGTVTTKHFEHPDLVGVSFFVFDANEFPTYSSLRALDHNGNVVGEQPAR